MYVCCACIAMYMYIYVLLQDRQFNSTLTLYSYKITVKHHQNSTGFLSPLPGPATSVLSSAPSVTILQTGQCPVSLVDVRRKTVSAVHSVEG